MPFILLRNFPSDFIPDQRALWCLFGSAMTISSKEDKEDVPFASYVPRRPAALSRWSLLSTFWGKQITHGWFAICEIKKYTTKSGSASNDDDDDNSGSDDDDNNNNRQNKTSSSFPELWINNTKLSVQLLPDHIARSTVGTVDITKTAKEMMHLERDMKRREMGKSGPSSGAGGGASSSSPTGREGVRRGRESGDGSGDFDGKKKKKGQHVQFKVDQDQAAATSDFAQDENNNNNTIDDNTALYQEAASPAVKPIIEKKKKPTATISFGKDCCQKCGSKSHFTRKCPHKNKSEDELAKVIAENTTGGEAPVSEDAATVSASDVEQQQGQLSTRRSKSPKTQHQVSTSSVVVAKKVVAQASGSPPASSTKPTAQQQSKFGPDCCHKCGSKSHFTRKCPHKNKSEDELAKVIAENTTGGEAPVSEDAATVSASDVEQQQESLKSRSKSPKTQHQVPTSSVVVTKQVVAEASASPPASSTKPTAQQQQSKFGPDCCHKCGDKGHFTRKCPHKNKSAEELEQIISARGTGSVGTKPVAVPAAKKIVVEQDEEKQQPQTQTQKLVIEEKLKSPVPSPKLQPKEKKTEQAVAVVDPKLVAEKEVEKNARKENVFGKDCCQLCGSKDHFTRKCPTKKKG